MSPASSTTAATLYLLDAEDDVDEAILQRWVAEQAAGADVLPLSSSRHGALAHALAREGDLRLGALPRRLAAAGPW